MADLAALVAEREVSAEDVVEMYLDRITRLEPLLHAYITVTAERARSDARQADLNAASGPALSAVHGMPIAVKDVFETAGIRTTSGARMFADRVPDRDADVIRRLEGLGAVLLGKTFLGELTMATPLVDPPFPLPRNPWDLDRFPGGSSGGSAVAVAAGLCAAALGTDAGGSIRIPASYCGVVGYMPTRGLVESGGLMPPSWSFGQIGPITRTVRDAARLVDAMAPSPASGLPRRLETSLDLSTAHLRVGVPRSFVDAERSLEQAVRSAFARAVDQVAEVAATVVEVDLPEPQTTLPLHKVITLSEFLALHAPRLRSDPGLFDPLVWKRVQPGLLYSAVDYIQAQRGREAVCGALDRVMQTVDVLITPTTPVTAPHYASDLLSNPAFLRIGVFTHLFNLTGQPSISVPCGFDDSGMPVGLMFSGRRWDDLDVLSLSHAFMERHPLSPLHPPLALLH